MNYLVKSWNTETHLNHGGFQYVIVSFFFDFRMSTMTANNLEGILKMFLHTLSNKYPKLEKDLADKNAENSFSRANEALLMNLLCESVRSLNVRLCAFIDGLDEYRGAYMDLVISLLEIQDRTNMKVVLASRPEAALKQAFKDFPQIQMQDHNSSSVRVYIDSTVSRGRQDLVNVDDIFDEDMRRSVMDRAEGVLIWVRLAVDELMHAARANLSREDLREILERLPRELKDMYDYSVSRQNALYQTETCLLLFLLHIFGGTASFGVLRGIWSFCYRYFGSCQDMTPDLSDAAILARIMALLSSFVDYVAIRMTSIVRPIHKVVEPGKGEIRLMHKTLQAYLHQSRYVQSLLPTEFKADFSDNVHLRFCSEVVRTATADQVFDVERLVGYIANYRDIENPMPDLHNVYSEVSGQGREAWAPRLDLLEHALAHIFFAVKYHLPAFLGDPSIVTSMLSSYLMVFNSDMRLVRYCDWTLATRHNFVDLFVALDHGFDAYVDARLGNMPKLASMEGASVLHTMLQMAATLKSSEHKTHRIVQAGSSIASKNTIMLCVELFNICIVFDDSQVLPLLLMIDPVAYDHMNVRDEATMTCGQSNDLYHWWILHGQKASPRVRLALLQLLFKANENVNYACPMNGTALHLLLNQCREQHSSDCCPLAWFPWFAEADANPTLKHNGETVLQLADKLLTTRGSSRTKQRKLDNKLRQLLKLSRKHQQHHMPGGHLCDFEAVIQALRFYEARGQWPDFSESPLQRIRADQRPSTQVAG